MHCSDLSCKIKKNHFNTVWRKIPWTVRKWYNLQCRVPATVACFMSGSGIWCQVTSGRHYFTSGYRCSVNAVQQGTLGFFSLLIKSSFLSLKASYRVGYFRLTLTGATVHLGGWIIDTSKYAVIHTDDLADVDCSGLCCVKNVWRTRTTNLLPSWLIMLSVCSSVWFQT